jgi:hypothetical protein
MRIALVLLVLTGLASSGLADSVTFNIFADGAKEVAADGTPNQGDPDGSAIGTILLDNGTGSGNTGFATINLSLSMINGVLSGHHIHQAPATTTGPIVIDFGNPNTILTGTPMSGTLSGTITGLPAATITSIFANPTNFYYNLHSTPEYPAGAVRDQIPEPSSIAILACGSVALLGYSWRRARRK